MDAVVTRAMTGHVIERMREHYSTVAQDEKGAALGNVAQLMRRAEAEGGGVAVERDRGAAPHLGADNSADGLQKQQRPVGRGGL